MIIFTFDELQDELKDYYCAKVIHGLGFVIARAAGAAGDAANYDDVEEAIGRYVAILMIIPIGFIANMFIIIVAISQVKVATAVKSTSLQQD